LGGRRELSSKRPRGFRESPDYNRRERPWRRLRWLRWIVFQSERRRWIVFGRGRGRDQQLVGLERRWNGRRSRLVVERRRRWDGRHRRDRGRQRHRWSSWRTEYVVIDRFIGELVERLVIERSLFFERFERFELLVVVLGSGILVELERRRRIGEDLWRLL
jgi:hypothetical protein